MDDSSADTTPDQTERRVYFRDIKPYAVVDSLDELKGPAGGLIELSHSVLWAPGGPWVDLDEPGGVALSYQAVLSEGTVEDQRRTLNADILVAIWADLMLPIRARQLWESRFSELRSAAAA